MVPLAVGLQQLLNDTGDAAQETVAQVAASCACSVCVHLLCELVVWLVVSRLDLVPLAARGMLCWLWLLGSCVCHVGCHLKESSAACCQYAGAHKAH